MAEEKKAQLEDEIDYDEIVGETDVADPPWEAQVTLLKRKIELWRNTLYDVKWDYRIAKQASDSQMLDGAKQRIKLCLETMEMLEKEINKIQKAHGDMPEAA